MKRYLTVLSLSILTVSLFSQYDPKENFYDAEFFFAEEEYNEALYAFNQVYREGFQENANINYRIGSCLLQIEGRKTEAIPYLEVAVGNITERYKEGSFKEEAAPPDAYLHLGNAYRINNQFDKAIKSYNSFLDYGSELMNDFAENQIEACKKAKTAITEKADYDMGNLGQVNGIRAPVYNPAVSGDLKTLAFMGRQKFYNGVYVTRKEEGKWLKPLNITPYIQSDGNQHVLSLSNDGNKLLLAWTDQFESDIWESEYRNNRWNKSRPLNKPVNSKYYESHACYSPDGKAIYFTSNRKESVGGMDIFKSVKNEDGSWSDIILLGENVNTALNEESPFVSPDGKRLYFSSQGHNGIGGFDVYYCELSEDGTPGKPVHLEYPLNTTDDDFAFSPEMIGGENYLALYAKGESDQVDIFRLDWIPEDASPVVVAFEVPKEVEEVAEVVEETVEETVEEVAEVVEEAVDEVQEVIEEAEVESYILKPIYFKFDNYVISPVAANKLDGLASIMNRFPTLKLEVIGHTDALGSESYNNQLARKRAQAAADYLKSKGIDPERMRVSSKGESDPVARNRTLDNSDAPKGRALNRRVQFKATVPSGLMIEVEKIKVPDDLKIK